MAGEVFRIHVYISGFVQGVFFRSWTKKIALSLGLVGCVKNLEDGRVELVAQGKKEELEKLIKKLKKGSFLSKVDKLDVFWEDDLVEFVGFETIR